MIQFSGEYLVHVVPVTFLPKGRFIIDPYKKYFFLSAEEAEEQPVTFPYYNPPPNGVDRAEGFPEAVFGVVGVDAYVAYGTLDVGEMLCPKLILIKFGVAFFEDFDLLRQKDI